MTQLTLGLLYRNTHKALNITQKHIELCIHLTLVSTYPKQSCLKTALHVFNKTVAEVLTYSRISCILCRQEVCGPNSFYPGVNSNTKLLLFITTLVLPRPAWLMMLLEYELGGYIRLLLGNLI